MDIITIIYTVMFFFGIYFLLLFILLYYENRKQLYSYPVPKRFPTITIITPAYNEEDSIANTLKALVELDYPSEKKEIIVVNDGSHDRTVEIVKNLMKNHKEIRLLDKKNSGKADSLNQAIKMSKGELIAVVDSDSYPLKDSLIKMVGYFEEKNVAAVTSRVLVTNKTNFIEKFQAFDYVVIAWGRKILDFVGCVYVTNGPLSIYRRSQVLEVGGFDKNNITEDIEITWHLLSKGYETKMSYSTAVYTIVPSKIKQWVNQRIRWNIGGLQTLYKYRSSFLRGRNLFGYFVISYVSLAFFLAFIGFLLMFRYLALKFSSYAFSIPYILKGYNPFEFIEFNLPLTILFILGILFLTLSLVYYKLALKNSDIKAKSIMSILIFIFIYRPLYLIPYLISIYRIIKGDVRWYTK